MLCHSHSYSHPRIRTWYKRDPSVAVWSNRPGIYPGPHLWQQAGHSYRTDVVSDDLGMQGLFVAVIFDYDVCCRTPILCSL